MSVPRPSASLIVVNSKNEILMVQRNPDSRSFAGAHVFPGGNFDKSQDESLEMTAIRETFEETGVLLASIAPGYEGPELTDHAYDEARKAIHSGKVFFTDFLSENGLIADVHSLLPFSTWVTPPEAPRRFRARFFVSFLPIASTLSGRPYSEKHIHSNRLPTPDSLSGGASSSTEVVSAEFIHPNTALSAFSRGEIGLMPPQFYILTTLKDIFGSEEEGTNTPAQREHVRKLALGGFGHVEINPRPLSGPDGILSDGSHVMVFEGDETRKGKKGSLHRAVYMPQEGTLLPKKLDLIRNIDLFKDLDGLHLLESKL